MHQVLSLGGLAGGNIIITFLVLSYVLLIIGPGVDTDAYIAGQTIPAVIMTVVGASVTHVLVPILSAQEREHFYNNAWGLFIVIGILFGLLSALLFLTTPYWVPLIFPGFADRGQHLAIELARVQVISLVFMALSGVLTAIYHARRKFYWAELAQLVASLAMLTAMIWALPRYGIWAAAWLSLSRFALQTILLMPGLRRYARPDWSNPTFRLAWTRIRPLLLGSTIYKSGPLVNNYLASMAAPGGLSLLTFAQRIVSAGLQVADKSVTAPMLPSLVGFAKQHDWPRFRRMYRRRLSAMLGAGFLAYLSFTILGHFLLELFVGYGNLSAENIALLWNIIVALGGMIVGGMAGQISVAGLYAIGETSTVMKIAIASFVISVVLRILAFRFVGLYGIALGITFYHFFNAIFLHIALVRNLEKFHEKQQVRL